MSKPDDGSFVTFFSVVCFCTCCEGSGMNKYFDSSNGSGSKDIKAVDRWLHKNRDMLQINEKKKYLINVVGFNFTGVAKSF